MRALILSDIHANLDALEAVLAAAPAHDVVWNLGDNVGYGASPNEVIEHIAALGKVFVRGNHDRACSGLASLEDFNPVAAMAASWTRRQLTPDHTLWLRQLARGPLQPHGEVVSCMHGSALDEDEYLMSVRDAWRPLKEAVTQVNFFGHTHIQGGFATNDEEWFKLQPSYKTANQAEEFEMELSSGARYLINPGSVGQPRDSDWRAAFALFDDGRDEVRGADSPEENAADTGTDREPASLLNSTDHHSTDPDSTRPNTRISRRGMRLHFYRVPYDLQMAQGRILSAGLPDRLAARLREGR